MQEMIVEKAVQESGRSSLDCVEAPARLDTGKFLVIAFVMNPIKYIIIIGIAVRRAGIRGAKSIKYSVFED